MSQANLSETLFKPRFKHPGNCATLVRRFLPENPGDAVGARVKSRRSLVPSDQPFDVDLARRNSAEILDVQARIVMEAERTDPELFDTVIGYRGGNWIFEWAKEAMQWQQKPGRKPILC